MAKKKSSKKNKDRAARAKANAKRRADERKNSHSSGATLAIPSDRDILQLSKGVMLLDIVPYVVTTNKNREKVKKGDLWYRKLYSMHRNVGPEEKGFICPKETAGLPCPVCEKAAEMARDPDVDPKAVKALRPKSRELFNVVDRKDKAKGVQLWSISTFLFGKYLDEEIREDSEGDLDGFFLLEDGMTLKLRLRENSFEGRSFLETARIDFKARKEDYDEELLETTFDLDNVPIIPTYDELLEAFTGSIPSDDDDDDDDEDDEDESPKSRKKKKGSKKKKDEDEDDEDDEDEDEDGDDEDEDGDDDDEDGDGDDEDEDEDGEDEDEDEDGDSDDEDEDSDDEDEDSDDDDDDEDVDDDDDKWDPENEDDEEEEEEKPKKKKAAKKTSKKKASKKKSTKKKRNK